MWGQTWEAVKFWRHLFMHQLCKERRWPGPGPRRPPICNPKNKLHLFALHKVFLPKIQRDLDTFVQAWNNHTIAGGPINNGRGGGIPNVLFRHPVSDATLEDEANFGVVGRESYGLEEYAMKAPRQQTKERVTTAVDPLSSDRALRELRAQVLEDIKFKEDMQGIDTYQYLVKVTEELVKLGGARPSRRWARQVSGDLFVDKYKVRAKILRAYR